MRGYVCRGDVILVNVPTADLTVLLSNASYHLSCLYEDSFSTPHIEHFPLLRSCPSAMGPEARLSTQDPDPSRPFHLGWRPRPSTWSCVTLGNLLHSLHTCERKHWVGASLVVQWLKLCLPMQGVQVQSLVRELRCHMPLGQ